MTIAVAERERAGRWGEEVRATLTLGWPLILTNLAQIAITTTDVVMLGWLGPQSLAAGTLGATTFYLLMPFGLGVGLATTPMLAQALGRRRHAVRDLRRTVRQGLWATTALTVPSWIALWYCEDILILLGQEPELAAGAGAYMRAYQWGLLPFLWFMVLRSFVAAVERPRSALVVTGLAIALNALLAYGLIFGNFGLPALGLTGGGLASTIANLFLFCGLAGFLYADRRFRRYRLLGRFWRADWPRMRELLHIGLPMSMALAFEVSVFNAAAYMMGLLGSENLAAHAIALQVASATFMVPLGLAQAATVRVGLAAGRGDPDDVRRAGWTALALGTGFMAMVALPMMLTPMPVIDLFLDLHDPATAPVVSFAVSYLAIAGLFQVSDGAQVVGAGALRGLKDTRVPMLFAALGYWGLGVPIAGVLGFATELQGTGIWLGLAGGLVLVAALMVRRWSRREALGLVPQPGR